uniref:Caeridin-6 n=1 Tax=Ranoidea caerulea TaxID=30344 RepID=CDN6_RANCA|nr:RecName: Full=Caeridin-6 [Ranoidea caerulea]prf//1911335F caeridin 6 [Ranoidea caerulea]
GLLGFVGSLLGGLGI